MDAKKVVIIVLILLAVVAFMALGAGAYRDGQEKGRKPRADKNGGVEFLESLTKGFRTKFDLKRLLPGSGCSLSGGALGVSGPCQVVVAPGSNRPSKFRLRPSGGTVFLCFAMTRARLSECLVGANGTKPEELEDAADFTVAADSAFLYLDCRTGGGCTVAVSER